MRNIKIWQPTTYWNTGVDAWQIDEQLCKTNREVQSDFKNEQTTRKDIF